MSVKEWRTLIKHSFLNKQDKDDQPISLREINNTKSNKGFKMSEQKKNQLLDMINKDKLKSGR